eukprot:c12090_g2_i1.p1 GENE.c12090_g2_i1~~c12090_g2_i1.p1  ORF type:complete len:177 (-),score=15.76 c12090_g2_i1:21-551(-)
MTSSPLSVSSGFARLAVERNRCFHSSVRTIATFLGFADCRATDLAIDPIPNLVGPAVPLVPPVPLLEGTGWRLATRGEGGAALELTELREVVPVRVLAVVAPRPDDPALSSLGENGGNLGELGELGESWARVCVGGELDPFAGGTPRRSPVFPPNGPLGCCLPTTRTPGEAGRAAT